MSQTPVALSPAVAGHPIVRALRQHAADIQAGELQRARRRLGPLAEAQERAVESLLAAIVDEMLRAPEEALEELAQEGLDEPELGRVRAVFGLR